MNCELFPRTAQLRLRTVSLLYHGTAAAAAAAIAAASHHNYNGRWILSRSELPRRRRGCRAAIILSLPCSSFELIPLIITTQRTLGYRSLKITQGLITHGGEN